MSGFGAGLRSLGMAAAIALALGCSAAAAAGQATGGAASPLLPPEHWAVEAARRAEAMGLAPEYLPGQRAVPRVAVAGALREAAERVDSVNPAWGGLVAGWVRRFEEEFREFERGSAEPGGVGAASGAGGASGTSPAGVALLGSAAGAGLLARSGVAAPGEHEFFPDRTGATPVADRTEAVAGAELAVALGSGLAAHAAPRVGTGGAWLERGELAAGWRRLRLSVGRAEVGYGVGAGGGVLYSGRVPIDRIEISTSESVRLPWILRWLGPFAFNSFVSAMPEDRHPGRPWLMGISASGKLHPRFTLSGHRGMMFGGDHTDPVGAGELFDLLIGRNIPGVDQIASTSFRLRLPTEALMPTAVYCEWGAEDSSGAPFKSPGLLCGAEAAALPGIPGASFGVEHVQFGARPENGPPWYRHHRFPGNWALDEAPLGHPLGGEGRQWLAHSSIDLLDARLRVQAQAFQRRRTGENLYIPGREGTSHGGSATLAWRLSPAAELRLSAAGERGEHWDEARLALHARAMF